MKEQQAIDIVEFIKIPTSDSDPDNSPYENAWGEDPDTFTVELIVGDKSPSTMDFQHCAYIDTKLKKAVFDACGASIFRSIKADLDINQDESRIILQRIKNTSGRALNGRYFRRSRSNFSIAAYSFQPTSYVIKITKSRCVEIYREIQNLIIGDLRAQWPRQHTSNQLQNMLRKSAPDAARLFTASKRHCANQIQRMAETENLASFDQTESGVSLRWRNSHPRKFTRQSKLMRSRSLEKMRNHEEIKSEKIRAELKRQAERSNSEGPDDNSFIPEINDW